MFVQFIKVKKVILLSVKCWVRRKLYRIDANESNKNCTHHKILCHYIFVKFYTRIDYFVSFLLFFFFFFFLPVFLILFELKIYSCLLEMLICKKKKVQQTKKVKWTKKKKVVSEILNTFCPIKKNPTERKSPHFLTKLST